jgi:ATP-dependent RNA helicase DHX36
MICTGVVLQWLQSTPLLENISHLIVDEIHERDINSDFLITIIKDILPLRPDLKVSSSFSKIKFSGL